MSLIKTFKKYLFTLCLLSAIGSQAQDIHFSQFFEAPLLRNPSLAGLYNGDIRVQAVYRDQWNSVTNAYRTGSLNAEYKMPIGKGDDFLTTGIQLLYDQAGSVAWVSSHALPAINYHKSLSSDVNRYLSLGVMAGVVQRRLDRSKMTTNSTYDGLGDGETFVNNQYLYADGAVGLSYNSQLNADPENNFFLGVAYHHFNKPKNSFYQDQAAELDAKMIASGGIRFSVTPGSYITLQADYSKQGQFTEIVGGALYGMKLGDDLENPAYTLHGGAFMRLNDAIIPVIKLDYHPFSLSFSYDVNLSKLKTSSYGRGGFELGISFVGFTKKANSSVDATLCPRF